ncbi:MAG: hypothetical protein ACRDID_06085, partial [Ktedonobacterales bacterium]
REARRREVSTLVAETLADNQRMLRLARRIFPNVRIDCAYGSCTLTIWLNTWQDDARRGYERVAC